jgi:fructose-bisphosphate aldolase class 1
MNGARLAAVGIQNTKENRYKDTYRQMLFEAPGCKNYLSSAILHPETLPLPNLGRYKRQALSSGLCGIEDREIAPIGKLHL